MSMQELLFRIKYTTEAQRRMPSLDYEYYERACERALLSFNQPPKPTVLHAWSSLYKSYKRRLLSGAVVPTETLSEVLAHE